MSDLLVMKFGGTSVGSAERMRAACDLITAAAREGPVVAVVSAMSRITDLLLDTTRHAEAGDEAGVDRNLAQLEMRHREAADELFGQAENARVQQQIGDIVSEFRRIINGIQMLAHRPPRAVDEAIAVGERLSALLISAFLENTGNGCRSRKCGRGDCHRCRIQ